MKLETRFNLIITSCLIVGLSITGILFYQIQIRQAEDTLFHDASLFLGYGQSVRNYTIEEITPALKQRMDDDRFLPQVVPSYAAHTTINKLRDQFPEYSYREVALNPTNTADRGNAWEVGIIQTFRNSPEQEQLSGKNKDKDSLHYYLAMPIRITDGACLTCHSDPAAAPENMKKIYGASNGFGWQMGEIIGARIVTVPAAVAFRQANNNLVLMLVSLFCIFLLTHAVFNYIFRRYITRPLEAITSATEDASLNRNTTRESNIKPVGQILALETAITRLRRSLDKAIEMLEKNK